MNNENDYCYWNENLVCENGLLCNECEHQSADEDKTNGRKSPEEIREDCFVCGGKNTMVGTRAKSNGHFHGRCEKCGCRIME